MISFPKDILSRYAHVGLKRAEMDAVTIPDDGSFEGGDILQTTHCLELILTGSLRVHFPGQYQDLHKNDIQFRRRGNYQLEPSKDYSGILFFIGDEFIVDFIKEIDPLIEGQTLSDMPPFVFKNSDFIQNNMDHALRKIMSYETFSPCIVKLTALQILFQIMSKESSRNFAAYLKYLITDRKIDLPYFMETNFTQNMSLEEMAKLTGRSISTFKKEFGSLFDVPPQKWLVNRRLEHAHYLLKKTKEPVSAIAYQIGFENISHFSRAYRLKYGATPTEARI